MTRGGQVTEATGSWWAVSETTRARARPQCQGAVALGGALVSEEREGGETGGLNRADSKGPTKSATEQHTTTSQIGHERQLHMHLDGGRPASKEQLPVAST